VAAVSNTYYHCVLRSNQWQEKCSIVFLPPRVSHITTVILQANVGISCSVVLKVMFMYLHTVQGRRNLYTIFQEKSAPYGLQNTVYIR